MESMKEIVTFFIKQEHIKELFGSQLGIELSRGSHFYKGISKESQWEPGTRELYQSLLEDEFFKMAVRIVAEPDAYVINRIGGGSMGLEEIRIHFKKSEGEYAVATEIGADGICTIQVFDHYKEYIKWWAQNFTGKNDETIANYIPPRVSLEEFLFILHGVDCFRRVSYENMLAYTYTDVPYMKLARFTQTMVESIASRDIRWLLPAFMVVLPGFDQYQVDIKPEYAAILMTHEFLQNGKVEATGEAVLTFAEAGQSMGVEFYRSWLMSSGFEINVMETEGFRATERIFVAPTALANHFVRLECSHDGRTMVNHQAYTKEQVEVKLEEIFEKTFKAEIVPSIKKPFKKFCISCGSKLEREDMFCKNCGTKV